VNIENLVIMLATECSWELCQHSVKSVHWSLFHPDVIRSGYPRRILLNGRPGTAPY